MNLKVRVPRNKPTRSLKHAVMSGIASLTILSSTTLFAAVTPDETVENSMERVPTEALVEGIKSSDGRWFEVELIIFERTKQTPIREGFDEAITNRQPRRFWDLQSHILEPNLDLYLNQLPECFASLDPFYVANNNQPFHFPLPQPQLSPERFFQQFEQFQQSLNGPYHPSGELCLQPDESLSSTWRLFTDTLNQPLQKRNALQIEQVPKRITGRDYDDFHDVYLVSEENLQLKPQFDKLVAQWGINPLLHIGWRQPGLSKARAMPVYLVAGKNYSDSYRYDGLPIFKKPDPQHLPNEHDQLVSEFDNASTLMNTQAVDSVLMQPEKSNVDKFMEKLQNGAIIDFKNNRLRMPSKQPALPDQTWQVDGAVTVHLNHYLYLNAEFNYRQLTTKLVDTDAFIDTLDPLAEIVENQQEASTSVVISAISKQEDLTAEPSDKSKMAINVLKHYPLDQIRRTYSGDLHYIDHPKFGILFQIRKYRH